MLIHGYHVKGAIDGETRCVHYHAETDRIALKFHCCSDYFPCHQCHEMHGCGKRETWPRAKFDEPAVLCGSCGAELTPEAYFTSGYACPRCKAAFNPNCGRHRGLYFET